MPRYPPDRWLDYTNMSDPMDSVPLLAIKVPLPKQKTRMLPYSDKFTFDDVMQRLKELNRKAHAVIDLTNTNYYGMQELNSHGLKYTKIYVEGHVIPRNCIVDKFIEAVETYKSENPKGIILVHCTHGVNRTGYLICRYLIDKLLIDPKEAIMEFETARGHLIERRNYVEDLLRR